MRTIALFGVIISAALQSSAQQFTLFSSRWVDVNSKSVSKTHSVIYIDSTMITIEQGESHSYLEIKTKQRQETSFSYTVLDYNDVECTAAFSPDQMTFEFQSDQYHLKYFIDSIQQEKTANDNVTAESTDEESDTTDVDSGKVKEDTKIYLTADAMPEFPGGYDAMKQWLTNNVKYPGEAKKDKIIGLVEVTAVVEKNGSLTDVKVKHDIGGGCGDEAIRAVKQMPAWVPGQIKGEDKRVKTTIKVFFPPK